MVPLVKLCVFLKFSDCCFSSTNNSCFLLPYGSPKSCPRQFRKHLPRVSRAPSPFCSSSLVHLPVDLSCLVFLLFLHIKLFCLKINFHHSPLLPPYTFFTSCLVHPGQFSDFPSASLDLKAVFSLLYHFLPTSLLSPLGLFKSSLLASLFSPFHLPNCYQINLHKSLISIMLCLC